MYPKKGWILAAALLILCSVGCTGQTGETHRLYVQTAGSESQIAETLPRRASRMDECGLECCFYESGQNEKSNENNDKKEKIIQEKDDNETEKRNDCKSNNGKSCENHQTQNNKGF